MTLFTVDASGDPSPATVLDVVYDIHPEPAKPDHLTCFDEQGQACPDVFPFWTGYLPFRQGTKSGGNPRLITNPFGIYNSYNLRDAYGNTTFGYTSTSATQAAANVTTTLPGPDYLGRRLLRLSPLHVLDE